MKYHDFIGKVQSKGRMPDQSTAVAATRATLETLGERILAGQARNLAAELPQEVSVYLTSTADKQTSFDMDTFWQKVSAREGQDMPKAVFHARTVFDVLQEAVSPGAISDLREALPDEFDPLFEAGSEGELA